MCVCALSVRFFSLCAFMFLLFVFYFHLVNLPSIILLSLWKNWNVGNPFELIVRNEILFLSTSVDTKIIRLISLDNRLDCPSLFYQKKYGNSYGALWIFRKVTWDNDEGEKFSKGGEGICGEKTKRRDIKNIPQLCASGHLACFCHMSHSDRKVQHFGSSCLAKWEKGSCGKGVKKHIFLCFCGRSSAACP